MNVEFTFWEKMSGVIIWFLIWILGGFLILWQSSTHQINIAMSLFLFFVPMIVSIIDLNKVRKLK